MDNKCSGDNCKPLQRQADSKAIACTKGQMAHEDIGDDKCKHCPLVVSRVFRISLFDVYTNINRASFPPRPR
jgi:hypothetical protein